MTNENEPQNKKNLLTLPSAIVLAGFLIAIAIFASNSGGVKTSTNPDPEQAFLENIINAKNTVEVTPITERDHIIGSPDAKIVIVEYSDTECPFCKRFHDVLQETVEKYGEDVAWVYRHFPIESLHAKAAKEAEATECAWEQGGNDMFWKYIDEIYSITPSNDGLDPKMLYTIAGDLGLDKAVFTECLDSGKYATYVEENRKEGENAGAKGTPYNVLIVKGKTYPVSGAIPLDIMEQLIDKLL